MRVALICVVVLAAGCYVSPAPSPVADMLPASLTDEVFWQMINDFSESGGTFDFEMFMSNETTFQMILPDLVSIVPQGSVYLGVAPEQNFTYIAALRPRMAFIIDIRRQNMLQMLLYKALFEISPTRGEFLSRLFSRRLPPAASTVDDEVPADRIFDTLSGARADGPWFAENLQSVKDVLQETHGFALSAEDLRTIEYILNAFYRGGPEASLTTYGTSYRLLMRQTDGRGRNWNFLATNDNFQFVREMHKKNLIVPVVGDFAGPKAVRAVARYLQDHNAIVGAFYVSNVEEYISARLDYCRNVAALPLNSSSTFIRFGRAGRGSFLGPMQPFVESC